MLNLKPYFDAAIAADAEKDRITHKIDALFNDGTDEGKKQALELRPTLDEARSKAKEANELYITMRDASLVQDNSASLFTPSDPAANDQGSDASKIMKRKDYDALGPIKQGAFVSAGGRVQD